MSAATWLAMRSRADSSLLTAVTASGSPVVESIVAMPYCASVVSIRALASA